jgi:hypothetical protein
MNLCYKNRLKIGKIARNRDFFKETIFSQKIAEKIGRFFGNFWAIFSKKLPKTRGSFAKNRLSKKI